VNEPLDRDDLVVVRERTYTLMLVSLTDDPDTVLETNVPEERVRERVKFHQEANSIVKGDDKFWPMPLVNVLRDGDRIGVAVAHGSELEDEVALGTEFVGGLSTD
jgi:hypothetical protein